MDIKSIVKSVTFGTAAGLVCYTVTAASTGKKRSIKKNAGKALKAAGNVLDEITSIIM
ncbi:MAG: hypothetical protein IJN05_04080 [Ruminococcus sp.]|jgi:hypothetical protein|nr:hypothetical protein [Ruminococcus sp.]MBR4021542.1 hypothetical protein [Ruminococcus sp.]MBR6670041.1 hypothetical protein [Ruminococcus sp.]